MSKWDVDDRGVATDAELYEILDRITTDGDLYSEWQERPSNDCFFLVLDCSAALSRDMAEKLAPVGVEDVEDLCHSIDSMSRPWAIIMVADSWWDRFRQSKNTDIQEVIRRFDKDKLLRPASTPLIGMSICDKGYRIWPMIYHSR